MIPKAAALCSPLGEGPPGPPASPCPDDATLVLPSQPQPGRLPPTTSRCSRPFACHIVAQLLPWRVVVPPPLGARHRAFLSVPCPALPPKHVFFCVIRYRFQNIRYDVYNCNKYELPLFNSCLWLSVCSRHPVPRGGSRSRPRQVGPGRGRGGGARQPCGGPDGGRTCFPRPVSPLRQVSQPLTHSWRVSSLVPSGCRRATF